MHFLTLVHKLVLLQNHGWKQTSLITCFMIFSDLLLDQKLDLKAANGTEMKYIRWTPTEFRLSNSGEENKITVQFLVTETDIDPPIVGFNVIELLIRGGLNQQSGTETLLNEMIATFTDSSRDNVKAFADFISISTPTELCTLKTAKNTVVIPKGNYKSYLLSKYGTTWMQNTFLIDSKFQKLCCVRTKAVHLRLMSKFAIQPITISV